MKKSSPLPGCSVLRPIARAPLTPQQPPPAPPARRGRAGRFAVLNAFVDATLRTLGGAQAKVWLILYRDTKQNGLVRATDADLARRAGIGARTVRRARGALARLGLLVVVRQGGLRAGPSVYRVRPLVAVSRDRSKAVNGGHGLRVPVSTIPEGSQIGRPDPVGSDALGQNRRAARGNESAP